MFGCTQAAEEPPDTQAPYDELISDEEVSDYDRVREVCRLAVYEDPEERARTMTDEAIGELIDHCIELEMSQALLEDHGSGEE